MTKRRICRLCAGAASTGAFTVLGGIVGAAVADVVFEPAIVYPTGQVSSSVIALDLSGNGWLDLATANRHSHDVSVLLNQGDGVFTAAQNYSVLEQEEDARPRTIRAADFNQSGSPDLVTANEFANTISIFFNTGDGTFTGPQNIATVARPTGMAVGDFNADGRVDLAVTHRGTGTGPLRVFINSGGKAGAWSGFEEPLSYLVGNDSREVIAADLNANGHLDLVVVNRGSANLTLLLGNGDGTFQPAGSIPIGALPRDAVAADLNKNGLMDLAVADFANGNAWVLKNAGSEGGVWTGFLQPVAYPGLGQAPHSITAADLRQIGRQDLIMANVQAGGSISVLLNDGNGAFITTTPLSNGPPSSAASVVAADLYGNRLPDIAVANSHSAGSVSVLKNVTEVQTPKPNPDLSGDGSVGSADLLILLAEWGPCAACPPAPGDCLADLSGDCNVGVLDLMILLAAWD